MVSDFDQIRVLLSDYFEGLYTGNVETLARIFHPRSRLFVVSNGALAETELPAYLEVVRNREAPQKLGSVRRDDIVSVSISSPHTAVACVRLILFKNDFSDQLSLFKDGGHWRIMTKMYHLNGTI